MLGRNVIIVWYLHAIVNNRARWRKTNGLISRSVYLGWSEYSE